MDIQGLVFSWIYEYHISLERYQGKLSSFLVHMHCRCPWKNLFRVFVKVSDFPTAFYSLVFVAKWWRIEIQPCRFVIWVGDKVGKVSSKDVILQFHAFGEVLKVVLSAYLIFSPKRIFIILMRYFLGCCNHAKDQIWVSIEERRERFGINRWNKFKWTNDIIK